MKKILVSQRLVKIDGYEEIREQLDISWGAFLKECGLVPVVTSLTQLPDVYWDESVTGLLLTGGNNLEVVNPGDPLSRMRDNHERKLIEFAISKSLPIVGVCRGMQMLCHYEKGVLCQSKGHAGKTHDIAIEKNSSLAEFYHTTVSVNSYHDYSVIKPGASFKVIAKSTKDSSIEAVECRSKRMIGIMWHPERNIPYQLSDISFFKKYFTQGLEANV